MGGSAEGLHALFEHLGNGALAGPGEAANQQDSRVECGGGDRRRLAGNLGVAVENPGDRCFQVAHHVVGPKQILPVLTGVAGAQQDGSQAGASPGLNIRGRVAHHP